MTDRPAPAPDQSRQIETLADAYPKQQARLRRLLEQYEELRKMPGVFVDFAVAAIKDVQRRADEASAEHDTVAMLRMYEEMKECQ